MSSPGLGGRIRSTMTLTIQEETKLERSELSKLLPPSVESAISYYAYENGHWAGDYEVDSMYVNLAREIVSALRRDGLIK